MSRFREPSEPESESELSDAGSTIVGKRPMV